MPASPVVKQLPHYPKGYRRLEKVIIPDSKTDHYYSVWYDKTVNEEGRDEWYASLMCCQMYDKPSITDNWYHVEELSEEHYDLICTIEVVFDISFHRSIFTLNPSE